MAGGAGADRSTPSAPVVEPFIYLLAIFLMACFVGYYVVWNVTPALHSPLMAVTNAISSVIIVGAMLADRPGHQSAGRSAFGFIAVTLASREHLRRLPGDPAHAVDVQEAAVGAPMSASLTSLCLPGRRRPVHPGAARPVASRNLPPGQPLRHDRHGGGADRHAAAPGMGGLGYGLIFLGIVIGGSIGTFIALPHPDDRAAAAGGGVPLAGRPGRGVRRRRGAERADRRSASARPAHPHREPDRDVARPGDRRHHLLRLGDRLRQAAGAHERRADHVPAAAQAEPGAGASWRWC